MTTTNNLDIEHLASNLTSPEPIINEQLDKVDAAIAGRLTINLTTDADYTLADPSGSTPAEWSYPDITFTDTGEVLTAGRAIIMPAKGIVWRVANDTLQTLTFKVSSGTGVAVSAAGEAFIYYDGSDIAEQSSGGGGGTSLPVDDTTALVRDPSDNTKQVRMDAGAVATGTTRVLSMPDRDIDLSGVIVESGSNANGEYWRWGNGLQVCYFRDTSTALVTNSAAGAVYVSTSSTLTFPAAFSGSTDEISVASASIYSGSGGLVWTVTSALTLTTVDIRLYSHADTGSGYPGYFAIGPWS